MSIGQSIRGFLARVRRVGSAWDQNGSFRFLLSRDANRAACEIDGIDFAVVDHALAVFCEAFDIPESQKYCLRPSDRISDIYHAMVTGFADDMEYERLVMGMEQAIGRSLVEGEASHVATIEDLAPFLCETQKA